MRRRGAILTATIATATLALIGPVGAVVVPWTLVGSPITATVFQSTTYTFTATNTGQGSGVGCVEIDFPVEFVIEALGTPVASDGGQWFATIYSGTNWVLIYASGGGDRSSGRIGHVRGPGPGDPARSLRLHQSHAPAPGLHGRPGGWPPMGHGRRSRHHRHTGADASSHAGPHASADPQANSSSHPRSDHGTGGNTTRRSHAHRAPDTHGVALGRRHASGQHRGAPRRRSSATHRFGRCAGGSARTIAGHRGRDFIGRGWVGGIRPVERPAGVVRSRRRGGRPGPAGPAVDRAPGAWHLGLDPGRAPDERGRMPSAVAGGPASRWGPRPGAFRDPNPRGACARRP